MRAQSFGFRRHIFSIIEDRRMLVNSYSKRSSRNIEEKCAIFFAIWERGAVLQRAFYQLRTRSERENGNSSADVERSRPAGRYLEVPTFGAWCSSLFPRPLMGLTSPHLLSRFQPFSNPFASVSRIKAVRVFGSRVHLSPYRETLSSCRRIAD